MLGIQSQDILSDIGIILYPSLTIYRLIPNAWGFSGHFRGCLFSSLGGGRRSLRIFARSDAAHRRAEVAHACLNVAPHGIGSAVVALIFSMAKREVTFLSGTAAIRRL
jgi:hypothetical protein